MSGQTEIVITGFDTDGEWQHWTMILTEADVQIKRPDAPSRWSITAPGVGLEVSLQGLTEHVAIHPRSVNTMRLMPVQR